MKATLSNYKQSPRKVRLIADLIRGKEVNEALGQLRFLDKRAAGQVKQVLESALANAKENNSASQENLYIKEITIDKGVTLKRFMPVSRGRAHPIHRHRSHIRIVLGERGNDTEKTEKKSAQKETKKEEAPKKAAAKKTAPKKDKKEEVKK